MLFIDRRSKHASPVKYGRKNVIRHFLAAHLVTSKFTFIKRPLSD
jgi:hypothetical protein